jgi:phospholipid N-methyltransferase
VEERDHADDLGAPARCDLSPLYFLLLATPNASRYNRRDLGALPTPPRTARAGYLNTMGATLRFISRFVTQPTRVGAIAPSSRRLGQMITADIQLEQADTVVEFGPGTGAFTPHILQRLKPGATFFALELDPVLCESFQQRFPDVPVYCDSVANVREHLAANGQSDIDCIVCGLPWVSFRQSYQDELMAGTLDALADGGRFATFTYISGVWMPSARAFRRKLGQWFTRVTTSPVVWANLPPAFVYRCVK